jgi:hypothetical protein
MGKGSVPRPYSVSQEQFGNNFDAIFRKKDVTPRVQENTEDIGRCGCGRSPTGKCVGWHALPLQEYEQKLADWKLLQEQEQQKQ